MSSADLDGIVADTIKAMKKCISKPPLTDKLLKRPPFRFLHDIVMELVRTHGYLDGLFAAEEQVSDNVKDKHAKMAFLEKAIDATMFVVGKSLSAKPSKIVAGLDPENTNIWLQAMAYAVRKKMDSSDAVARVLRGEKPKRKHKSGSQQKSTEAEDDKPKRPSQAESTSSRRERSAKEGESSSARKSRHRGPEQSQHEKENEHRDDRRRSSAHRSDKRAEEQDLARPEPSGHPDTGHADPDGATADVQRPSTRRGREESGGRDDAGPRIPREDRPASAARSRQPSARASARQPEQAEDRGDGTGLDGTQPSRPEVQSIQATADEPSNEGQHLNEDEDESLPGNVTKNVRMYDRPTTARPAPPRRRKPESDSNSRISSAVDGEGSQPAVAVITGNEPEDDADDNEFLVEQREETTESKRLDDLAAQDADDGEQGSLMRRIMEKKGDDTQGTGASKDSKSMRVSSAQRQKEREQTEKEIDIMTAAVQNLCRNADPLGKIIDYIQEDVDSMKKELVHWENEYDKYNRLLEEQQGEVEQELQPLKTQLADLEQQVRDEDDLVTSLKQTVLENEAKIQRLLSSVSLSSRS